MYSMCAGLLTALTSSQSSHCSCCNLTFMRCHFSVDYQLDRCPALQCTHCHPFHPVCANGVILHFWVFCQLSLKDKELEREHGAERKRCYRKKERGQGRGTWEEKEKGMTRRKGWRGTEWWKEREYHRWNQDNFGSSGDELTSDHFTGGCTTEKGLFSWSLSRRNGQSLVHTCTRSTELSLFWE